MNKKQFKSKLALTGITQGKFAKIIGKTENTVSYTVTSDRIPVLWQLALEALETYSSEQIDKLLGVD